MWGKILGALFGFALLKIPGLLLGLLLGHWLDKVYQTAYEKVGYFGHFIQAAKEKEALFFYTTFAVMGHIAKSNGRVSEVHIVAATELMRRLNLSSTEKKKAQDAFSEGKDPDFPLKDAIDTFRTAFLPYREMTQLFLELQVQIALCDGVLSSQEKIVLEKLSQYLKLPQGTLEHIIERFQAEANYQRHRSSPQTRKDDLSHAYQLLGVTESTPWKDIKKSYRRLMSQNHPDKLMGKGLPESMLEVAKQKTQDIQRAYDLLKEVHG
ncbi:co-chaperone DjlA [Algicola sagamiensis]|uniref:co-chaperone DjlA n=1 Tax=Algicola sagamiensis TaxID=163869 RepID=UPI000378C6E9|nr:co-chaperone DjlA [Algicola sagamiensis]